MKRVVIAIILILFIVSIGFYSLYKVRTIKDTMNMHIDAVTAAAHSGDYDELQRTVRELCAFWEEEERALILFVRHAQIDELTKNVSRLPSMAAYENYSELFAELDSICWQIEHVWETERPIFRNVLRQHPF